LPKNCIGRWSRWGATVVLYYEPDQEQRFRTLPRCRDGFDLTLFLAGLMAKHRAAAGCAVIAKVIRTYPPAMPPRASARPATAQTARVTATGKPGRIRRGGPDRHPGEADYYREGAIMQSVLRRLPRA
jgi:hypothetical protein